MNDYCHVNIYYQPITIMVVEIVIVNIIWKSILKFWTPGRFKLNDNMERTSSLMAITCDKWCLCSFCHKISNRLLSFIKITGNPWPAGELM